MADSEWTPLQIQPTVIWKYAIPLGPEEQIDLPLTSRVVHVECLPDNPQYVHMWVRRPDPSTAPFTQTRTFVVFGTGQAIPQGYRHVGTAVDYGRMVWHLMEKVT